MNKDLKQEKLINYYKIPRLNLKEYSDITTSFNEVFLSVPGKNIEINNSAADVNKDGKIDNKDYAILMQYLNGWDVTLGEQA